MVEQGNLGGFAEEAILKFFGVPYAAPPVGERRWRSPAAPPSWQGIRPVRHFSPACPQTVGASFNLRGSEQSEDCLYLNVWTQSCRPEAKRPVLVWFHGGGNRGGAGSEDAFDGTALAKQGATVVSFNYRLGAFGFLAHPTFGANFAVLDHLALLRWAGRTSPRSVATQIWSQSSVNPQMRWPWPDAAMKIYRLMNHKISDSTTLTTMLVTSGK